MTRNDAETLIGWLIAAVAVSLFYHLLFNEGTPYVQEIPECQEIEAAPPHCP